MSAPRPAVALTIDGNRLTALQASLTGLRVDLGVGSQHDRFAARLAPGSPLTDASTGQSAMIELGFDDNLASVLTGTVTGVQRDPWGVVLHGLAATAGLAGTRVGRSYVGQSAADIVTDLLGAASVDPGDISCALQLSAYHVHERRSAWAHVCALAQLAGCETSADGAGALNFRPPNSGSPSHSFRFGAELVAWDVGPSGTPYADIAVVPFGAASALGPDEWHVLLREPDGGAPTQETLVPGALRDEDSAQIFEQALRDAHTRRQTTGQALVGGDATIRAGDVVTLADVPSGSSDPLRVTRVAHAIDGACGFSTALRLEGVA